MLCCNISDEQHLTVQRTLNKLGTYTEPLDLFISSSFPCSLSVLWPEFEAVLHISSYYDPLAANDNSSSLNRIPNTPSLSFIVVQLLTC